MYGKSILFLASAIMIQSIAGQCIGNAYAGYMGNPAYSQAASTVATTSTAAAAAAASATATAESSNNPNVAYASIAPTPLAYSPSIAYTAVPTQAYTAVPAQAYPAVPTQVYPAVPVQAYSAYESPVSVPAYQYEAPAPVDNGFRPLTLASLRASRGAGLMVTSSSPIAPTGVSVQSDNMVMEGPLAVSGQLPFLGVVSIEGPLQAIGQGAVAYGCGNGNVGMISEGLPEGIPAPYAMNAGIGASLTGLTLSGFNNIATCGYQNVA